MRQFFDLLPEIQMIKPGDHQIAPVLLDPPHHFIQSVIQYIIIAVHKTDIFPCCFRKPTVSGTGNTMVRLVDHTDPGILFRKLIRQNTGTVRRSVHDQQNLYIRIRLSAQTFHTAAQRFFTFINRYDDTDHGFLPLQYCPNILSGK